jgi:molecular chaperone DnaK
MAKIGIDFGTTNSSLVAYDSKSRSFEYFGSELEREKPTPSVVWYHDSHIDIGKVAKDNYNKYCDIPGHHLEKSIKSKLGSNKQISVFGKLIEPFVVGAEIIKHLRNIAEKNLASKRGISLDNAVFSVPINFTGKQRADLRKSAALAGINIETFIHEPFAALIGYIYSEMEVERSLSLKNSYVLVFDWGGGTLDITVVEVKDRSMYEVGTSSLTGIAGDKFDDELASLVKNRFIEKYSTDYDLEYINKMLDEKRDRILANAEQCKIDLSTKKEANILVEDIIYDERTRNICDIDEVVSRSDFESCIKHHVDAAMNRVEDAIKAAGISTEQISFVLMTGGTSNIPIVREAIEDKFGSRVKTARNPDLVIAQGAAVVAEMGWSPFLAKNIMIELSDGSFWTAFPEGMPLVREKMPEKREEFICVDTRDLEAKLIIAEGKSSNVKDKNLSILNIPVEHHLSMQSPDTVVVDFTVDENIVLKVKGYGKQAGKRKQAEIHNICFGLEMR